MAYVSSRATPNLSGGGGEINDGANVGIGQGEVFRDKTGVTLNFKKLQQGANITITNNADEIIIAGTGGGSANITEVTVNIPTRQKEIKVNILDASVVALSQLILSWGNCEKTDQNHPSLSDIGFNVSNIQSGSFDLEIYAKDRESLFGNYILNYLVG